MFTVHQDTSATTAQVWDVLADGWSMAGWVVGASRIREVDPRWPAPQARVHHSAGSWPLLLDDTTSVVAATPGRELVLQARGWPFRETRVKLTLTPTGHGCRITMSEDATGGPAMLIPATLRKIGVQARNTECLRRLALVAEGRAQ